MKRQKPEVWPEILWAVPREYVKTDEQLRFYAEPPKGYEIRKAIVKKSRIEFVLRRKKDDNS